MHHATRRTFLHQSLALGAGIASLSALATPSALAYPRPTQNQISLATWSINRTFFLGGWTMDDLFRIVREDFGLDGIEHVNQFFDVPTETNLKRWNKLANDHGLQNVLIMVDHEGEMVSKDKAVRQQSVINHRKWVDIAAYMGCHAIRCNAHGGGKTPDEDPDALERATESFSVLCDYAKASKINVLIENHGGLSSFPGWLPALCKKMNNPNFGLLPDYGNYAEGSDVYKEVQQALEFAHGVSVKVSWNEAGEQTRNDLPRLLKITQDAGYTGFWGIESGYQFKKSSTTIEEAKKGEWQAVRWTKEAIEKHVLRKG